jgi:hypothetical protein
MRSSTEVALRLMVRPAHGGLLAGLRSPRLQSPNASRRLWLAGGEVPSMRGQGEHPIGCHLTAAQYADLETDLMMPRPDQSPSQSVAAPLEWLLAG